MDKRDILTQPIEHIDIKAFEQMVFAEATSVLPLIASHAYHKHLWDDRPQRRWSRIFEPAPAGERK